MNEMTKSLLFNSNLPATEIFKRCGELEKDETKLPFETVVLIFQEAGWEFDYIMGRLCYKDSFIHERMIQHLAPRIVDRLVEIFRLQVRRCGLPLDDEAKQVFLCFFSRRFNG